MRARASEHRLGVLAAVLLAALGGCNLEDGEQILEAARGLIAGGDAASAEAPVNESSRGPDDASRLYYQFVDRRGQVRFVERLADVPVEWRDRVGFVEMSVPPPLTPMDARRTRQSYSSARRASGALIARAGGPPTILFYSAEWCGWCRKAKAHMDDAGIRYDLRDIDTPSILQELVAKTGQKGIPVFDVGGRILTGFDPDRLERLVASL